MLSLYRDAKARLNVQVVLDHTDKPGVRDRQNFSLHWSVDYWQNFTLPPAIEDSGSAPIPSRCGQCPWQNYFNGILPFVMTSRACLPCSASSAKPAAYQKKPIDGFPDSKNKQENVLPEVLPDGRTFCPRPFSSATNTGYGRPASPSLLTRQREN